MERIEISKRLVLVNSLSSIVALFLNVAVQFWLIQYLLARISPENYSIYPVIVAVLALGELFTFMLSNGLGRFAVEAYAQDDKQRLVQIVSTLFPLLLLMCGALAVAGYLLGLNIERVLNIGPEVAREARIMLALLVGSMIVRLSTTPFTLGLFIKQRFVAQNGIQVIANLLRALLLVVLLVGVSPRVMWIAVARSIADVLVVGLSLGYSLRLVPELRYRPSQFRSGVAKDVVGFGFWSFLGQIAVFIHESADSLILNRFAGAMDVNILHIGAMGDSQLRRVGQRATGPVLPALTAMHAGGDDSRLRRVYLRGCRYELWVMLAPAVPAICFAPELINLYVGSAYSQAAIVLILLLASYPFLYSTGFLAKIAFAKGRNREFNIISLGVNIANLGLTLYLVASLGMGAVGAALSTFLVRSATQPLFLWPLAARLTGASTRVSMREVMVPGLMPAFFSVAACLSVRAFAPPATWGELILFSLPGLVVYAGVMFLFGLRTEDRAELRKFVTWAQARLGRGRHETKS